MEYLAQILLTKCPKNLIFTVAEDQTKKNYLKKSLSENHVLTLNKQKIFV